MFKNDNGFSLPELMMAAALLGALSLGVMKLSQNGVEGVKRIESGSQIEEIRKEILGHLSNREACLKTFALFQNFSDVVAGTTKVIPSIRDRNNNVRFSAGQIFPGGAKLTSIEVKGYSAVNSTAGLYLNFEYNLNSQKKMEKNKRLDLQLELDSSKMLLSCVAMAGVQNIDPKQLCDIVVGFDSTGASYFNSGECQFPRASCEKIGGVWDTDNNKCELSDDKYGYPESCSMTLSHSDNGGPFRSATLNMNSGGLIGVRLRGAVNGDDRFSISSSCGSGNDMDEYIKNCSIGFGWKDSTDNNSSAHAYPLSTKTYNGVIGSTLTLQTSGEVNEDDSFYVRMRCPNGTNADLDKYVKSKCQICFGQSDMYKSSPENMSCGKVQNMSDGSWVRYMSHGVVSADDAFYLGFFCEGEYSPLVKQWSY